MTEVRLTYTGPPDLAGALVSMLQTRGLSVGWLPPPATREGYRKVQVDMTVTIADSRAAASPLSVVVNKFRTHFPQVVIELDEVQCL